MGEGKVGKATFEQRFEKLQQVMQRHDIDAVALVPGANLFYLTGLQMHTSERVTLALLTRAGQGHLILPGLEVPRAETRLRLPLQLYAWNDAEGSAAAWLNLKRDLNLDGKTVAVEFLAMRVLELTELQTAWHGLVLEDANELLAEMRMVKDAAEIEAMRRAARVIEASLTDLFSSVKVGMTEKQLAARWQLLMHEHGADTIPDEPIVAAGPNSASPHTTATERALQTGDLVIFDGWCTVDGYYTDITRTIAVGQISDELRMMYEVVARANLAARESAAPGARCEEVDRAAREVISREELGEYFLHRTGHGLGLEVHEAPSMVQGNLLTLVPGMTFTIEPGVYVAGQGCVRIEDDIVVTQDGAESLTTFTRELMVL